MNAAMPTPNRPEIAGCSASRRTSRHTVTATPPASAAISAGRSPAATLTTTNTATGMLDATMPATPPICSSSVGTCRSGGATPDASVSAAPSGPPDRSGGGVTGLDDLVVRVVEHLAPVAHRDAPAHPHRPARLDARDPAATQPDERHPFGAVEQLRLQRGVGLLRAELHAAEPTEDRDLLAAGALHRALRPEIGRASCRERV